jgi:hypothetical protein
MREPRLQEWTPESFEPCVDRRLLSSQDDAGTAFSSVIDAGLGEITTTPGDYAR